MHGVCEECLLFFSAPYGFRLFHSPFVDGEHTRWHARSCMRACMHAYQTATSHRNFVGYTEEAPGAGFVKGLPPALPSIRPDIGKATPK